ncbi:TetR/AcrR family transcriptional regulator [Microbacterium oxydans]|uniref:Bacterial regulatory protein, tetR family n=1 Tax=Microbacterium oxydans TaxID=82380 RepID=A0A0F0LDV9_9MICO|nr:TetR family transcriptional regulator C-terminal domain-containing protein [Microbacterium oxydans]KJL30470.1 Bacterial regulatory protein, tetR family [Microbacterium oxydans]
MPRLIDHDSRARQIGEAVLRVLVAEGLSSLSVRKVADEAGIATASLRRAFPTQDALQAWCFTFVRDRVAARIGGLSGEGRGFVLSLLEQLLPLDDDRRAELVAQLQLATLAITQPHLRSASAALTSDVRAVCRAAIDELVRTGELRDGAAADLDVTTDALHATLDGIALQALLDPATFTADVTAARLARSIDALVGGR